MADAPAQPPVRVEGGSEATAVLDNRTGLPDQQVAEAVRSYWVENAAQQFGAPPSTFQLYATTQGSLLARVPFRTPTNVIEEIKLARSIVDTDDDVAATMGQMIATAFGDGMQNLHEDEKTVGFFNEIAKNADLDMALKEIYREYLIASQFTTLSIFYRTRLGFYPTMSTEQRQAQLAAPLLGVLPSENIRVITNDIFRSGALAYKPDDNKLEVWLREFFNARTTPARKAAMASAEPITAAIFTAQIEVDWNDDDLFTSGQTLWVLNPRMCHRRTMPKGASPYPRPLLTRNFALLEAKRLLSIMDYSLLQGGTNYIVVAKVGSDKIPAQQPEVDNMVEQVRMASRSGVLVGDHRITIDIITPQLDELLNPTKRQMLGRKLAMALLRIPEQVTHDPGTGGASQELQFAQNTITSDRRDIKRHVEATVYEETANRNRATFVRGAPVLWLPRIVLQGTKDFYGAVLQARDRGDIPRRWAVEALGFDYDAGLSERKREVERGDDETLAPASVPWSAQPGGQGAPGQRDPFGPAPGDIQGRPPGSSSNNGRGQDSQNLPSARPRQLIQRTRGETIRAFFDPAEDRAIRVGELTYAVLDQYPDAGIGRITDAERDAIETGQAVLRGPVAVVPVNPGHEVTDVRVFRLEEGLAMCVGARRDGAMVAKAITFREPHWDLQRGEETARRWGFPVALTEPEAGAATCAECGRMMMNDSTVCPHCGAVNNDGPGGGTMEMARLFAETLRNLPQPTIVIGEDARGGYKPGYYVYVRCPNCGLVQDAANDTCTRCGHDLTDARKAMFAQLADKGDKPTLHRNPPPPASEQPDIRNTGGSS